MDRNSAIGLTLIAALLLIYFYWFSPQPEPAAEKPVANETTPGVAADTARQQVPEADSSFVASFGDLSKFVKGVEKTTAVENENLKIVFSSKGGSIKDVELKNYKTYWQTPLKLVSPQSSKLMLTGTYKGKDVNLYDLHYDTQQSNSGDTTILTYTIKLSDGASLSHIYSIPAKGYEIKYQIKQDGLDQSINGDHLRFQWEDNMIPTEKDLTETRNNSTVNYCLADGTFENLSEMAESESENITAPVKWVSFKNKFFVSAIIAEKSFAAGEVATHVNAADTSVIEYASAKMLIAKTNFLTGANFKYYFGPNDYQEIGDVAPKFSRNVYLGWPPVFWINKFIIFPVFHFLTTFIANYGLIIVILVILLKLVLFPLSYKSYLSMAKMKVLKPELDAIKEKNGDDMTKVQQEQLKLYQQVGVNPISGCVPVLLQMPILFAMFYLFPASIELRQQPFLWAEDLSTYDSLIQLPFSLPFGTGSHISLFTLLMTVSTLIYTWQNNQLSSVQGPMKSMSYIMPVIFFFVLNRFSAGLTFYYFVSNLVTFAQQAVIRRFVDENKIKLVLEENRKRNLSGGNGKKSKFMSKLEEAMKASEEARKRAEEERKKKKK
jgi:YidC/Oxa1 family membrane protein insertase